MLEVLEEQERRRAEIERHRENSGRLAQAFAKFDTEGQGYVEFADRIDFGLTFVEQPYVTYGSALDLDDLADLLDLEPGATPPLPLASGFVTEWDRDERDFYIGAWIAVRVYFPMEDGVTADVEVPVTHYFTFTATAIKDVPLDDLRD